MLTCPALREVSRVSNDSSVWRLRSRGQAPHLVRQPFEALLGVVQFRRGHGLGPPGHLAGVQQQLLQYLAQRLVASALWAGFRAHAVCTPTARSSAFWNSRAVARTADASPASA